MLREPYGHIKVLMAVMAQGCLSSGNSKCKTTSLPFLPRKPYVIAIPYLGATVCPLALVSCRNVRFCTDDIYRPGRPVLPMVSPVFGQGARAAKAGWHSGRLLSASLRNVNSKRLRSPTVADNSYKEPFA